MKRRKFTPHPHALLLPALTDEEYQALKADISQHGILYPIIVDENDQILDGVHRQRIANELNIDLPIQQHKGLSEDRKLHLAVGLNMRRRHLDADRRRDLVRQLHQKNRLSLRRIADVTGWSKSTVERDLKTSPYQQIIGALEGRANAIQDVVASLEDPQARNTFGHVVGANAEVLDVFRYTDSQWKRGNWPLPLVEQAQLDLVLSMLSHMFEVLIKMLEAKDDHERQQIERESKEFTRALKRDTRRMERIADDPVKLQRWAEQYDQERGIRRSLRLDTTAVPNGTPTVTATATARAIGHCAYCGAEFTSARSTKKFCSDAHRQMAYRERRR